MARTPITQPSAEYPDFEWMLASLCGWASSLPWVVEKLESESGMFRLFTLDCEPLAFRKSWFGLLERNGEKDLDTDMVVVMSKALAWRALTSGRVVGFQKMHHQGPFTVIDLPTCADEFRELQGVLEASYSCAFQATY